MLDEIAQKRVFASVYQHDELARVYVESHQLSGARGEARPEARLASALRAVEPQRVHIVGNTGAGKTGMIFKVLGDHARLQLERPYEALVVNVGDRPSDLADAGTFLRTLVQQIASQEHRFASVDRVKLTEASAIGSVETGPQVEHRAGIGAPVSYHAALKEAFTAAQFGDSAPKARQDFEDVLNIVSRDYRPLVVIDDTEHFVDATDGRVQEETVASLYANAIRPLAEMPQLDLIVAMHPHYERVSDVAAVADRFGFEAIEVPALPVDQPADGLTAILQRRLERHALGVRVADVVEEAALAQLNGLYFTSGHDLRVVLNAAHDAVVAARDARVPRVRPEHLQPVLDRLARQRDA